MRATKTIPLAILAIAATLLAPAIRASAEDPKPAEQLVPIEGKVVDEAGQPVVRAKVRLFISRAERQGTATDSAGHYKFSVSLEPPLPGRVAAAISIIADDESGDREGFAPPFAAIGPKASAPQLITLKPIHATIIKVTDADGQPVEGATFTAPGSRYFLGDLLLTGKTDAGGIGRLRYTDDALVHKVIAFKSGVGFDYVVSPLAVIGNSRQSAFSDGAQLGKTFPQGIPLKLRGARTLRIRSVGPDGKGVPGVAFNLEEIALKGKSHRLTLDSCPVVYLTTDASGIVVFDWLPQNFAGAMKFGGGGTIESQEKLTLHANNPVDEITLPLLRQAKMSGHVYLPDGKPAPGITVISQIRGQGPPWPGRSSISQVDGSYSMELDPDGEPGWTVGIGGDRWAAPPQAARLNAKGDFVPLDFKLTEGAIVRGTVTEGSQHAPVKSERVDVASDVGRPTTDGSTGDDKPAPFLFRWRVATDAQGRYQFRLPPGRYTLQVAGSPEPMERGDHRRFDFEVTDEREIVKDFELPLVPTTKLTGQVLDSAGQPAASQKVSLFCIDRPDHGPMGYLTATTNGDGIFSIDRPPGSALLQIYSPDHGSGARAILSADQREITVQMQRSVQVRGRLLDATGQPVEEGHVYYGVNIPIGPRPSADSEAISLAGDGSYHLEFITPGIEYNVVYTEKRGENPVLVTHFTAQPGQNLDLGDTPIPAK